MRSAAAASVSSLARVMGANDRIRIGMIGCGGMGRGDLNTFFMYDDVDCPVICDIDDAMIAKTLPIVEKRLGKTPDVVKDFRKVIERKDIDAILVATPDHWHALPAVYGCQAGKDVYVEKPLAVTIGEGRAVLEASRRHNRVVQMGTQWRSSHHWGEAVEFVQSGKLGKIRLRHVARPRASPPLQQEPVPFQLPLVLGLRQRPDERLGRAPDQHRHVGHGLHPAQDHHLHRRQNGDRR